MAMESCEADPWLRLAERAKAAVCPVKTDAGAKAFTAATRRAEAIRETAFILQVKLVVLMSCSTGGRDKQAREADTRKRDAVDGKYVSDQSSIKRTPALK